MRGKDNNGLGLDFRSNVFAYALQFCIGGMVILIHYIRLPRSVGARVSCSSKDGHPSETSWILLTPPWERLLKEISENNIVDISWSTETEIWRTRTRGF